MKLLIVGSGLTEDDLALLLLGGGVVITRCKYLLLLHMVEQLERLAVGLHKYPFGSLGDCDITEC